MELGVAYALSGRVSEALPLLERGLEQPQPPGIMGLPPLFPVWRGEGYVLAGRLEEAMQLGQQALEVTRTQKQQGYQAYALRLLGDIAAHHTPPAVEAAERQYRRPSPWPRRSACARSRPTATVAWACCMLKTSQREQARTHSPLPLNLYRAMEMTFWLPQAKAVLAEVHSHGDSRAAAE